VLFFAVLAALAAVIGAALAASKGDRWFAVALVFAAVALYLVIADVILPGLS